MKHYGDITKIHGSDVPLVDIVCGGSPCQDLSIAGKRAGLAGERSGLFMEQIRIIKEMRNESIKQLRSTGADDDLRLVRPRYMVWENVPGAFSSNGGEDFRAVLEETARIADENAVIPRPAGKWTNAGCIMGDGWSIAWRLHDAQFWGVPQRRRRIALVADFGGETAPEILFERESVSGDLEESGEEGEDVAGDAERGTDSAISFLERSGKPGGVRESLYQEAGQEPYQHSTTKACSELQTDETMYCIEGNGSRDSHRGDGYLESQTMYTLNTIEHHAVCIGGGQLNEAMSLDETSRTLNCMHDTMKIITFEAGENVSTV